MTPEQTKAFEKDIGAFVGRDSGPPQRGHDPVNASMIRHWCEVLGDKNPVYTNEAFAVASNKGEVIAPPAMMQAWSLDGYPMATTPKQDVQRELHQLFDRHGFTGVLGTNSSTQYYRDLTLGEDISTYTVIDSISDQKATARGIGYFIETVTYFVDQQGENVGKQTFRVLKFIPNENKQLKNNEQSGAIEPAVRIAAPRGHDNGWWWDAVDNGKVLIQRCKTCKALRHPPRPMCGQCQSVEWDHIESKLDGTVFSYTTMHYPQVPGYSYPLICAVIELSEGTRLISNINGVEHTCIAIGMKVKGRVEKVDEKTMLPQFYPVQGV